MVCIVADYKLHRDSGDVIECDRCGSPDTQTVATEWDDIGRQGGAPKSRRAKEYLCVFCYETHLGVALDHRHRADLDQVTRGLCQALNILLRRIDSWKAP